MNQVLLVTKSHCSQKAERENKAISLFFDLTFEDINGKHIHNVNINISVSMFNYHACNYLILIKYDD